MEHLTIGQRIAACRKNLGLSQEALGEKVGVSRQAISKWEADGAVPEIDKLIALSRLFHVSVGWLLGVEEAEAPVEEKAEVSEELLRKIEEIVLRYQPKKQPVSGRKKAALILAAVFAVCGLLYWSRLTLNVGNLSNQVRNYAERNDQIMAKLNGLESQLNKPEDTLLSSYTFDIVPIHIESEADTSDAQIHFSAAPTLWQEGDVGILSIRHPDKGTLQAECDWDGSFLTAMIPLGSDYGYELCFTIRHADGTQVQQMLENEEIRELSKTLRVDFTVSRGWGEFDHDGIGTWTLTLDGYTIGVMKPEIAQPEDAWTKVELILKRTQVFESEIIGRYDLLIDHEPDNPMLTSEWIEFGPRAIRMDIPEIQEGDGLVLWLNIEMSNGMRTFTIVDQWSYSGGAFSTPEGTCEYP